MICLATLNTWKCDGEYFERLEVINNEIRTLQPHIFLLQEAFQTSDNAIDTTQMIAEQLGYYYASTESRPKKRQLNNLYLDSYSNVSIVSKFPIINRYIISLPTNAEDGGREAIAAEIEIDNKKVLAISIHLSHLRNGNELRKQQLMHIFNQPFMRNEYAGVFIGGDFNCAMSEEFLRELEQPHYSIEDTYTYKKGMDGPDFTFSSQKISRKIDHILQYWLNSRNKAEINDSAIVFNEADPDYGIRASDHNGVMVKINI